MKRTATAAIIAATIIAPAGFAHADGINGPADPIPRAPIDNTRCIINYPETGQGTLYDGSVCWAPIATITRPADIAGLAPAVRLGLPAPCEEDEPCWDCTTMGNHICGPVAAPPAPKAVVAPARKTVVRHRRTRRIHRVTERLVLIGRR